VAGRRSDREGEAIEFLIGLGFWLYLLAAFVWAAHRRD
jgi:hypothetical protein